MELLSDVEKIRVERRKAKLNKHKYTGTGNDGFGLSFSSGGSRYGGFGSDSYNSGSYGNDIFFILLANIVLIYASDSGSYGAGSSAGPASSSFRDDRRGFEEYNAGDDEISSPTTTQPKTRNPVQTSTKKASAPPPPPAPVEDLLGGLDDDVAATTDKGGLSMNKDLPSVSSNNAVGIDGPCCYPVFVSASLITYF